MTNLEAAAHDYAKAREAAYIKKMGRPISASVAHGVYSHAFRVFTENPARHSDAPRVEAAA